MGGRRPEPTALRVLRGNPGKRGINHAEPQSGPLSPDCPDELTNPLARKEWDRVAPALIASGAVTVADRSTLIAYCQKWAEWLDASKKTTTRDKALTLMFRFAQDLGMTPSSRSRVHAVPTATGKGQSWAAVLK